MTLSHDASCAPTGIHTIGQCTSYWTSDLYRSVATMYEEVVFCQKTASVTKCLGTDFKSLVLRNWRVVGETTATNHCFLCGESMQCLTEARSLVLIFPRNDGEVNFSPVILLKKDVKLLKIWRNKYSVSCYYVKTQF